MSVFSIVNTWEQQPFARGTTDCCAFVNYVVKKMTGESKLPDYDDNESALAILNKYGSLRDAVTHYVGADPIDVDELLPGDIVLLDIKGQESIGILLENGNVAVVFEYKGLREVSINFCDEGWSVGH